MSWIGQVFHVAAKDLRQSRFAMLIYVAVVLAATIGALVQPRAQVVAQALAPLLVVLACILMASVVENDAPVAGNIFWTSRPLFPSAVLVAKVSVALLLIALPLLGEAVGLAAFDVQGSTIVRVLARSLGIASLWLLATIVIAAFSQDLRAFVVAFLILVVGVLCAALIPPVAARIDLFTPSVASHAWSIVVGLLLSAAVLAWTYERRSASRVRWAAAAAIVAAALFFGAPPASPRPAEAGNAPDGGSSRPAISLAVTPVEAGSGEAPALLLRVRLSGVAAGRRATFSARSAVLHFHDGSTRRQNYVTSLQFSGASPLVNGELAPIDTVFRMALRSYPRPEHARDVTDVELLGVLAVADSVPFAPAPLALAIGFTAHGLRLRVGDLAFRGDTLSMPLQFAGVDLPGAPNIVGRGEFSYALVGPSGDIHPLFSDWNGSNTGWVVMPGAPLASGTVHLNTVESGLPRTGRLSVVRWVRRYASRVTLSSAVALP